MLILLAQNIFDMIRFEAASNRDASLVRLGGGGHTQQAVSTR